MKPSPPPATWISQEPGEERYVLLHGMVMAPCFWQTYAPPITRRGATVAYPLPGHAPWLLEGAQTAITREMLTDQLAAAIRRDFDGKPVVLIGHSTGGFTALLLALAHPDLVKSIVLIGAFACGRFDGQERLAARLLRIPHLGPLLFRQFFRRWTATSERFRWGSIECVFDKSCPWEDEIAIRTMDAVRHHLLRARPDEIAACIQFMSSTSLLQELSSVAKPVLNIIGANDEIVPPPHQLRLSRLIAGAQTVILRNCGHLPMVEHREMTDTLIEGFLRSPPGSRGFRDAAIGATFRLTDLELQDGQVLHQPGKTEQSQSDGVLRAPRRAMTQG
ncbi:alpha/beta hydrolase [Peteryoungia desertarenae]|uniref:Alpha/beta hydrolase n=1 Tax=Peteryoungia desertarenae TaxID=1813451 RepID=A0ABX6QJG0_9HYPH|nr:alpha/beta hydrolase [Peteryoungia desertarenae]QLF68699.1 alpha/beta hydrolase [Peteryoungia desertarenae]